MEYSSGEDDNLSNINKRRRDYSGSKYCGKCDIQLRNDTNHIECDCCGLFFCQVCTGIPKEVYTHLAGNKTVGTSYHCKSCKRIQPTLQNIDDSMRKLMITNEKRLKEIDVRVNKLEVETPQLVHNEITKAKHDIQTTLATNVTSLVDARHKELEDRKNKSNNIILFNVPEQTSQDPLDNKRKDERTIQTIASSLGTDDLAIVAQFRMGKRKQGQNRPLVAVLEHKKQRKSLLEKARQIKDSVPENLIRVILTRDLTQEQRRERKDKKALQDRGDQTSVKEDTTESALRRTRCNPMFGECSDSGHIVPHVENFGRTFSSNLMFGECSDSSSLKMPAKNPGRTPQVSNIDAPRANPQSITSPNMERQQPRVTQQKAKQQMQLPLSPIINESASSMQNNSAYHYNTIMDDTNNEDSTIIYSDSRLSCSPSTEQPTSPVVDRT